MAERKCTSEEDGRLSGEEPDAYVMKENLGLGSASAPAARSPHVRVRPLLMHAAPAYDQDPGLYPDGPWR